MTAALTPVWNDILTLEQTFKICDECGETFWGFNTRTWCTDCMSRLYR